MARPTGMNAMGFHCKNFSQLKTFKLLLVAANCVRDGTHASGSAYRAAAKRDKMVRVPCEAHGKRSHSNRLTHIFVSFRVNLPHCPPVNIAAVLFIAVHTSPAVSISSQQHAISQP